MRTVHSLILIAALSFPAAGRVWTSVYRCDEVTPLSPVDPNHPHIYEDIMVGTRLAIVVSSDTGRYWRGHLRLSWDDAPYATLSGRGPVDLPGSPLVDYEGSRLDAAGAGSAWDYHAPLGVGIAFASAVDGGIYPYQSRPGEWFIFDYRAEQIGVAHVGLYDCLASPETLVEALFFGHVPSRDSDGDMVVNFEDFALFAQHWNSAIAFDPDGTALVPHSGADGRITMADLASFSPYWLRQSDCDPAPAGQSVSSPVQ
jgi:hypothetical protein